MFAHALALLLGFGPASQPSDGASDDRDAYSYMAEGFEAQEAGDDKTVAVAMAAAYVLLSPSERVQDPGRQAFEKIDASNGTLAPSDDWDAHQDRMEAHGNLLVGVGSTALIGGTALFTAGALLFAKDRQRPQLSASVSRNAASLTVWEHF